VRTPIPVPQRSALVVGFSFKQIFDALHIDITTEYRYYGSDFNIGFIDRTVSYRKPLDSAPFGELGNFGNTVGSQLYPLALFNRPFSQWAVFTEYQGNKNLYAGILQAQVTYFFHQRFRANVRLDLNYIASTGDVGFFYPFYDVGLGWEPVPNSFASLSLSNKLMNLDRHYMTAYLNSSPTLNFRLQLSLASIKL
jgi:hypothetical protein